MKLAGYRPGPLPFVLLGALVAVLLLEIGGQIYATSRPSYRVFYFEPDPAVGWKMAPDFAFLWTGTHWFAREFSVPVRTNSLGFRDRFHALRKPPGTRRVAVIGDSLVEALQVPSEQTATGVLEEKLNRGAAAAPAGRALRFEVLNFGVSLYGLGQLLLVWETYASAFSPDYVIIPVTAFLMRRTAQPRIYGGFLRDTSGRALVVRPTFEVEDGRLLRRPADYDAYRRTLSRMIKTAGGRIALQRRQFFLPSLLEALGTPTLSSASEEYAERLRSDWRAALPPEVFELNLRLLEELATSVRQAGARLAVADFSPFFNEGTAPVAARLREVCEARGIGYIAAWRYLVEAEERGVRPRWKYDAHLNETGNEIFAQAMYDWLARDAAPPGG